MGGQDPQTSFHQEIGEHVLPLTIESSGGQPIAIAMRQAPPVFGAIVDDRAALARALRLSPDALGPGELPPQVVSTGTGHLLVAVAPQVLAALQPDHDRLRAILMAIGGGHT